MATTSDLEAAFRKESRLKPGEVRMLTRILQDAELLPKGRRGGWRNMPELTTEHCAIWLVGLAVTRRSGLRNVAGLRKRIERVLGLVNKMEPEETFGGFMAHLITDYADDRYHERFLPLRILIVNDDTNPTAEVAFSDPTRQGKDDEYYEIIFVAPEYLAKSKDEILSQKGTAFADAFVIGAEVLFTFREVFGSEGKSVDNDGGADVLAEA